MAKRLTSKRINDFLNSIPMGTTTEDLINKAEEFLSGFTPPKTKTVANKKWDECRPFTKTKRGVGSY